MPWTLRPSSASPEASRRLAPEPVAAVGEVALQADIVRHVGCRSSRPITARAWATPAWSTWRWPTSQTGAVSQRPMQGARDDAHVGRVDGVLQPGQQLAAAHHRAGEAVADPDRDRRRRRLALLHHVEVGVEGRDLVHLRLRQPHLVRERRQVLRRQAAVAILDQVQELDQQVPPPRPLAEKLADLVRRRRLDLPPPRREAPPPTTLPRLRRPRGAGPLNAYRHHCPHDPGPGCSGCNRPPQIDLRRSPHTVC